MSADTYTSVRPSALLAALMLALVLALAGYHLGTRRPSALARCTRVRCAEASTIQYGGIPHVAVIVGDAKEALTYYTEVLGTTEPAWSRALKRAQSQPRP